MSGVDRTIALLGGPASGKTTYLGALARALREEPENARLRFAEIQDDESVLSALMDPLFEGQYPQRTKAERHRLRMALETVRGPEKQAFSLTSGDYDGEEIERLFRRAGAFTEEWRERASATALLLFVRHDANAPLPHVLRAPPTEAQRFASLRGDSPSSNRRPALSRTFGPEGVFGPGVQLEPLSAPPAQPRDAVKPPTMLALIEVLQFLRHERGLSPGQRPSPGSFRVGVLISAWDAVDSPFRSLGPAKYLTEQMPLLNDYLWSNFHEEDQCVFGLSSTGGDLRDPHFHSRYTEQPEGFVEHSSAATLATQRTRDLSLPVRWALFGDPVLGEID